MSLSLLENKIKNRECVPLLNIMPAGGKGSRVLAECSRRNEISEWPGWGGRCAEGHDPFTLPAPDSHPNLGKNTLSK